MNLLFDLDGTLTNPFQGITNCISYALERMGRPSPPGEELIWCIGPPLKNSFAKLLATDDMALAEKALAFYRERFGSVGLFENEVYDGIPEALETLKAKGHALYLSTAKPRVYAERIMDHFGLTRYFKHLHGAELDGTRNDKTSLISHILKTESIPVSETVMIGDRKYDMIGAKENDICGFGVLWGYGTKDELEISGASAFIKTPYNLAAAFNIKEL
ncbi:MAG: HAD family hydrolase [Desulfobacterales bacterium RIFOXYA12_FULL_46_15]|nr:MAG: HAD family hydrolase [Desulfobacula sp. GWF2_41_7]OGR22629.1 MAG: HAD family hydrolase [Desulfobacterales bacterium RIFOXYA12_FULL_46_15]